MARGRDEDRPHVDVDVAGVGIGPFNLSLAALLWKVPGIRARFFEARPRFEWHSGLLFEHAVLQSPYLKDLVLLVDPTSPFTFLNYLVREGRMYRFVVADYANAPRAEFNRYFQWACKQLDCLSFGTSVKAVAYAGDRLLLDLGAASCSARHLVLGVGHVPNVPEEARPYLCDTVFHGGEYLHRPFPKSGAEVVVVGGGQTGAEIFYDLVSERTHPPRTVTWVTRRHNFVPFDDSAFANELYVPGYAQLFFRLPPDDRARLLELQKYSSDAILAPLLLSIYRRLYQLDYLSDHPLAYRLLVDRTLAAVHRHGDRWAVVTEGPRAREVTYADVVILATGFKFELPPIVEPIVDRIELDAEGRFVMNEDFSIVWDGEPANRIYAHNAALHSHGWIDPNFAGMAWRSAVIVNSLAGEQVYDLTALDTAVDWAGDLVDEADEGEAELDLAARTHG
jgi:lysine N6-hydroxylase